MHHDSLKKRYFFKLISRFIALAATFLVLSFVPRILGPADYGRFQFITDHFQLVFNTFTLTIPAAYLHWVSRKSGKENIDMATGLVLLFLLVIAALLMSGIAIAQYLNINEYFWPDIPNHVVWGGYVFGLLTILLLIASNLADGKALTVGQEKRNIFYSVFRTILLIALLTFGLINLPNYFLAHLASLALVLIISSSWLFKMEAFSFGIFDRRQYDARRVKQFFQFVAQYSRPLVLYSLVAFGYGYFDRWFLQWIGGAVEQGFFGLSFNLGSIAFLFSSAMTTVLTREFALAHEDDNIVKLKVLFDRIKLFFISAGILGMFLSVQSSEVITLFGGREYKGAILAVSIMAFYPIHQTFGQLSAALMLSTGKTSLFSKIGIFGMFAGTLMTYLFLAPSDFFIPGLHLGSFGLVLKMVLLQLVITNIQLFYNTQYLKVSYIHWIMFQLRSLAILYLISWILAKLTKNIIYSEPVSGILRSWNLSGDIQRAIMEIGAAGFLYLTIVLFFIRYLPENFGLTKPDVDGFILMLKQKVIYKRPG